MMVESYAMSRADLMIIPSQSSNLDATEAVKPSSSSRARSALQRKDSLQLSLPVRARRSVGTSQSGGQICPE